MSAEKHQALIESGQLNADGTRTQVCECCGRAFGPGDVRAVPEAVVVATVAPDAVDEGVAP